MTDTLKRQPWRIIWPTTKKYDAAPEAAVETPLSAAANHPVKSSGRNHRHAHAATTALPTPAVVRTGPLLTD